MTVSVEVSFYHCPKCGTIQGLSTSFIESVKKQEKRWIKCPNGHPWRPSVPKTIETSKKDK